MADLGNQTLLGNEQTQELDEFRRTFGEFGGVERRFAHIGGLETRDNGDPESLFSVTGSAIVFNRYSLDLGGFKEEIAPEAVREAMEADDADYHLLWDHDTTLVLARNRNGTLNAEIGPESVDFWGRVAKTSYAADLRVLMDRGDVDECSFAFTIADGGEEWRMEDDGTIVRRVTKIEKLWDLTICARGAYPQTQSATVRSAVTALAQERGGWAAETRDAAAILVEISKQHAEERALTPGLVAWDDEMGYWDVACDIECELAMREQERYVYWWLIDLNVRDGATEAIVCRYDCNDGCVCYYLVSGITYDAMKEPVLPDNDSFQPVDQKWVAVTEPAEENDDMGAGEDADDDDEGDDYAMRKPTAGSWEARIIARVDEADAKAEIALRAEADAAGNPDLAAELIGQADGIAERHVAEVEEAEEPVEDPADDEAEAEVDETEEPAENEDENEAEAEEEAETEEENEDSTETEEEAEERKRKAALARARGRAALV